MAKITRLRDLTPDSKNCNKGTERGTGMLEQSLRTYGAGRSILIDKKGRVIAGNKTVEQAAALGMDKVQVVESDGRTIIAVQRTDLDLEKDARAKELAIADNRVAEVNLDWDLAVLEDLGKEVDLGKFWLDKELADMFEDDPNVGTAPEADRSAELREKWQTATGQLWQIGRHRLLCGSATSREDHDRLLGGVAIDAVITDPPYGVGIKFSQFEDTRENVRELIRGFMPLCLRWPVAAICSGHRCMWDYPEPTWILAWVLPFGGGQNPWGFTCFHPVLVYGGDPYLHNGLGGRPDSLIESSSKRDAEGHPTIKPSSWWKWLIQRCTIAEGNTVLDPFCGSGTTLACCEELGRIGYGLEIDPNYVAVSLDRLAGIGLQPELIDAGNTKAKQREPEHSRASVR